ncbi:class I alpha-mannosidase 1A [Aspergillus fischeri NRRL 181]|uniref:alpha-1,2-Mannosidase n=1 Tax=Neosartorya fischeri (strain ATCC 1020 / DSM 3700 / CBS 544.65 / FGSC A1164 / JCM 1740 / NRRL 181 / WB 181) TaxID=331117 RepID=A1DNW1_NEOFI|nr:class I alpha-mannosidase 1A [Aspergillus fischeri NRRL 181]EAW16482.1 class I alpha-mannosidase 1A [Aspergillus fischeri NRRL 181]
MFRARRYRVSLVFAVIFVLIFIHFSRSRDTSASTVSIPAPVDQPKTYPQRPPPAAPNNKEPIAPESPSSHEPTSESVSTPAQQVEKPAAPDSKPPQDLVSGAHGQASSKDSSVAGQTTTSSSDNGSAKGDGLEVPPYSLDYHGHARLEVDLPETNRPTVHWKQVQEHYPLAPGNLIKLPTGKSKALPRVQAAFRDETTSDKIQRVQRLSTIKAAFEHAWNGYKTSAMGHDEIKPLRGGFRDPFMGWAATLVDSLDTLWIMDLKDEFAIAVDQVKKIDFTTSKRDEIPVFETVIRYLGGLLGAYDISGHKYDVLLEKAVELADIVMGAFDTPNRMPTMFYKWAPHDAAKPHLADFDTTLAEIGSLSVEFTRLAQLTKQDKYYDAIARITNELEKLQGQTMLPGLWPLKIDASGCRTAASQLNHEVPRNGVVDTEPSALSPTPVHTPAFSSASPSSSSASPSTPPMPSSTHTPPLAQNERPLPTDAQSYTNFFDRRDGGSLHIDAEPANYDAPNEGANSGVSSSSGDKACSGGLAAPPSPKQKFGLGARGDSTYEYLPKEYMLLGGLNEQYPAMYKKAMNATREHLLFQPMVKDERDLRFLSTMTLTRPIAEQVPDSASATYEGTHLGCFAGGMFALGAKLFGIEGDLDLAAKLTNACVWAYGVTKTGIMPEHFLLVPCKKGEPCVWNEIEYWNALDPNEEQRIAEAEKAIEQKSKASDPTKRSTTNGIRRRDSSGKWHVIADSASTDDLINHDEDEVKKQDAKDKAVPHEVFVTQRIMNERLPPGVARILNRAYLLRPEAIESVFYMFRITGDNYWRERGWEMFQAVSKYTRTEIAHSAINDVTLEKSKMRDTMESFWLAETLKYFYLLFADPSVVSLDDYVLNTEAHPLKRPAY